MSTVLRFLFLFFFTGCVEHHSDPAIASRNHSKVYETISAIPPLAGYDRIQQDKGSFGEWLRNVKLKKDNHVYLYDGKLKRSQSLHFAVLDIPVGNKDLQQCADAVMRLRAEYLFSCKRYSEIEFRDNENKIYKWNGGEDRAGFEQYLERVFNWCGTASLEKQLKPVKSLQEIKPGDVFIKGGFPGHAMIVTDVAINKNNKKIFMLAQSYMPAQDIHIVKNLADRKEAPWYEAGDEKEIDTPEWIFQSSQLRRWE